MLTPDSKDLSKTDSLKKHFAFALFMVGLFSLASALLGLALLIEVTASNTSNTSVLAYGFALLVTLGFVVVNTKMACKTRCELSSHHGVCH